MPFLLVPFVLLLPLLFVLLLPFSLVQRYRAGTARRVGRSWLATLNLVLIAFSVLLFIVAAAVTNVWIPEALRYALGGLGGGVGLGLIGLRLTRWELTAQGLHYTPHRGLVLLITFAVAVRIFYGFVRGWRAWHNPELHGSWLSAVGVPGSLAIGAVVLGYYLTYWSGVARRVKARGRLKVISVQ